MSNDIITLQLNNSNNNYSSVYIKYNTNQVYVLFVLLLIEIHQNCASQTLKLLCIAIFRNRSRDCQIKMVGPITVILKHFKACIFQTVGPIFMKYLPSIRVCKKLSASASIIFCVRFPLRTFNGRVKNLRDNFIPKFQFKSHKFSFMTTHR